MKKFGWLFIGTGAIANKVAKEIIRKGKHCIVASFSRNKKNNQKFAKKFNAKPLETLDEALAMEEVEGVYIATPHASHYELIKKCINANKAVLCEKAFTINAFQATEVCKLSKEKGVYLGEAMWMKFNPINKRILSLQNSNKLGNVEYFGSTFGYNRKFAYTSGRLTDPNLGGGALLDVGVYCVEYALSLFGEPDRINVEIKKDKYGVDLEGYIEFLYKGGEKARFFYSHDRFTLCRAIIVATKVSIIFPFLFFKPNKAICKYINGKRTDIKTKRGYSYEFDKVAADILAGKIESEEMTHADSIRLMKTLDRIRLLADIKYPQEIEKFL